MVDSNLQAAEKDLLEVERFLSQSERFNIKRLLNDQKILCQGSIKAEREREAELKKKLRF